MTNHNHLITTINGTGSGDIHPEGSYLHLSDTLDIDKLNSHVKNGLVTRKFSPDRKLSIYKYSKICFEWDDVTLQTRGLIVDNETNRIIARGFNKFFNDNQLERFGISFDPSEEATVMTKEDGSLGIAYFYDNHWAIATQGSFTSEMAIHATEKFNELYPDIEPIPGRTFMFEIIYPENKIITDYHGLDDLIFLGATDQYGHWISPLEYSHLPFSRKMVKPVRRKIKDVLSQEDPNDTSEGHVIRTDSGLMIKHKYPSYLELHKAKFNLNNVDIWENIQDSEKWMDFISNVPDEFHKMISDKGKEFLRQYSEIMSEVVTLSETVPDGSRKDKAIWINQNVDSQIRPLVMNYHVSGNDISDSIWNRIKPKGDSLG